MREWIDYDDALRHVATTTGLDEAAARAEVHAAIRWSDLPVRAERVVTEREGYTRLTSYNTSTIDWNMWRYGSPTGQPNELAIPLEFFDEHGHLASVFTAEKASGIQVKAEQLQGLWPLQQVSAKQVLPSSRRDSRGVKSDPRWEPILIAAAKIMYARKRAGSLSDLIKEVWDSIDDPDGGPSETSMKEHLAPLWRAFKAIDST